MTKEKLKDFRDALKLKRDLKKEYELKIELLEKEESEILKSCDHKHEDGSLAKRHDYVCLICRCGVDFDRIAWLEKKKK